uniref:Predicted gene, 66680 n=1 Tax=Mus musculus TaxID=10090 RepID=A0A9L6KDW2_MOUSE
VAAEVQDARRRPPAGLPLQASRPCGPLSPPWPSHQAMVLSLAFRGPRNTHRYYLMCGSCPGDCPWPSGMRPQPRCASSRWTSSRPTSTSMRYTMRRRSGGPNRRHPRTRAPKRRRRS